jgi:hypothetical protein
MDTKLRKMLTSGTKPHQLKHQTKDSGLKDYRNFVALINPDRRDAFSIQKGDRRLAMIEASDQYSKLAVEEGRTTAEERKEYFAALWGAVEDEASLEWLARYLVYDVHLDDWNPEDIPQTRIRTEQQELNVCPVLRFLQLWQSGDDDPYDLYYVERVQRKDAQGIVVGEFEERTLPLKPMAPWEASQPGHPDPWYKATNLFSAFKDWCRKTGASTAGTSSENAFTQRLAKYVTDTDKPAKNPQGIGFKRRTKHGARYWMCTDSN